MRKEYILQGLGCANCAAKIEAGISSINGVDNVSVNFMTSELALEMSANYNGNIYADVEGIVHKYESDVEVIEKTAETERGSKLSHENGRFKIARILAGAVIFAAGLALKTEGSLKLYLYAASYIILGGDVILAALKNIAKGQLFDENFLMSLATAGAFAIGEYPEASAVMLFYQVGEFFQDSAVKKSRNSISELMDIRPDYANIIRNDEILKLSPSEAVIGDTIIVKPGEKIPLDGIVTEGASSLDTKALTGEALPRDVSVSDTVVSGCINLTGLLTIEVKKTYGESTVAKIIEMVENASAKKAPTENFITKFSKYYTPAVVVLATLIAVIPPVLTGAGWAGWIHRGLVFLVISCPCALVISIPLGYFGGIGAASRKGILVKGGSYLEALNFLDIVVFDKTGTLTKGVFEVTDVIPSEGFTEEKLLEAAANAEAFSNHPIALSVLGAFGKEIDRGNLTDYSEIPGRGISVAANGVHILAGNGRLMGDKNISYEESDTIGTKVYVAVDNSYAGCIVISDELKTDSVAAVAALKKAGVRKTVMLTGDNSETGKAIAAELQLDEVYTQLLPDQKVEIVEMLDKEKTGKLAFVGDGINDVPVLARADIGVAMGGLGSDAAIEAADIVLMTDEPLKLLEAVNVAKFTKRVVWQNIVFALGIKGIILIMGAFGAASMWEAVFADVGVSVLAILNSMRVLKMK